MTSLFLYFWLLTSCQSNQPQNHNSGYIISGKVKTPPEQGWIVLRKLLPAGRVGVDSVKVGSDHTYTLKGKVSEPGFYFLDFFKKQYVLFILDNNKVEINADGEQKGTYSISGGSKDNDYLKETDLLGEEIEKQSKRLKDSYLNAQEDHNLEKQKQVEEKFGDLQKDATGKVKDLIRKMGTSPAVFYTLNLMDTETQESEFGFLDSLSQKFEKLSVKSEFAKQYIEVITKKRPLSIGKTAPDISLSSPEGKTINLSSLRGKYVLIDFWASWCGPCRQENPNVVKLYNKYKNNKFEIFGVSLDKDKTSWTKAIEKDGLGWVHVSDLRWWESSVVPLYQLQTIPHTYLIDPNGVIIAKNLRGATLENKLLEIFKQ